jgi:hypothetical protein
MSAERERERERQTDKSWGLPLPLSPQRRKPHCHRLNTLSCSLKAEKGIEFFYIFLRKWRPKISHYDN